MRPLDSSELNQKKQSEDVVRLNFELEDYVDIKIGDYIVFEKTDTKYYLNKQPEVVQEPKKYSYTCRFEGPIHSLPKYKVMLTTPKTGGGYYLDYKFPLTGNAQTLLLFIVDNLNRAGGSFTAGSYKSTSTKTINFNNWNVLEAITEIAKELEFDWYLENNVLHFDEKGVDTTYMFQVGRQTGLTSLTRSRVNRDQLATVVYGYGSTQNLPPRSASEGATYDGDLLTENRLSFEGVDGESRLEKNVAPYGRIEQVVEFDDIKPEFTGKITSIATSLRDFYDTSIPFDINEQLITGITPKITFTTGKLIGLTFNISYDVDNYKVTMDYFTDPSGQYPNDIVFAEVGDEYKIFDVAFPQAYIDEALTRLEAATQEHIDDSSKPLFLFEANVDSEYLRVNDYSLNIGDVVRVTSGVFNIDNLYEIKELTQKITDPFEYTIKFGTVLPKSLLTLLNQISFDSEQSIYNVERNAVTNNQVTNIIGDDLAWASL